MTESNYRLRFLPLFYEDLEKTVDYISINLQNSEAANALLNAVENAILKRLPNAESFEKYNSKHERKYPYYRIYIGNYIVFYVVIDDDPNDKIMEVRRILFAGRDRRDMI